MLKNFKYFVKHSFIYSIGNFATKASGIILLPIFSTNLTISEFGALGVIEVTIAILVELINLGQGQALVMLNNSDEYLKKKKEVFFTIFSTSLFICIFFVLLGELSLPSLTNFLADSERYYLYLRLALYIIAIRILNNIFLNKLRADERSGLYTITGLLKLTFNILLIIYFVAYQNLKVEGVLYSYIVSEIIVFFILIPILYKEMRIRFEKKIMTVSIQFGLPLIFSSLAMMFLNVSDRYIIKYFMTDESVGLYDLGYRIAGVLNMFVIMPLSLTLIPQAYKMFGKEGDKQFYSKILTYLTLLLVWLGLAISLFSKEITRVLALNPNYWPAETVIPIVVLAYIFFGMRIVASLGMYLKRNTKYVAITTIAASILNITLNIIFIPVYGIMAAAYATLIAFIFLYFFTYYFSNISYPIKFEHFKTFVTITIGIIFYFITSFFDDNDLILNVILKVLILIIFPFVLYLLNIYEPIEIERLYGFYNKWKSPMKWKENIKSESMSSKKDVDSKND